eukprot:5989285-Pleurochrysis_carterae.AAC.1
MWSSKSAERGRVHGAKPYVRRERACAVASRVCASLSGSAACACPLRVAVRTLSVAGWREPMPGVKSASATQLAITSTYDRGGNTKGWSSALQEAGSDAWVARYPTRRVPVRVGRRSKGREVPVGMGTRRQELVVEERDWWEGETG